jgi:hypothetical protein
MVDHMVWIEFKASTSQERRDEHIANLNALIDNVPGIIACRAGANFTDRSGGFTHGLLVTLEDRAALEVYRTHPNHVAVADPLREDSERLAALDFEY